VNPPRKPWWQQATALVSLTTGGAVTGLAFVPGTADQVASPASIPVTLTALDRAAQPAASDDAALRAAIVNVANHYLRVAQGKAPAQVEALIWQQDGLDGADHGESCAAFASMTLALAAQAVGQQSWVTGGSSYPWPLHEWADVRVDPNPASPGIISVLQDAEAHGRWHPLGDGYEPLPGDWVLFDGHVEVVTSYSGGVLSTIGGDSGPNLSVNAHQYPGPLSAQGVAGFVNNGSLTPADGTAGQGTAANGAPAGSQAGDLGSAGSAHGQSGAGQAAAAQQADGTRAAIPGLAGAAPVAGDSPAPATASPRGGSGGAATATLTADGPAIPGMPAPAGAGTARADAAAATGAAAAPAATRQAGQQPPPTRPRSGRGTPSRAQAPAAAPVPASQDVPPEVDIPGMPAALPAGDTAPAGSGQTSAQSAPSASYHRHEPAPASSAAPGTAAQQAFINQVAPGAIAAQRTYGVPAAVTIAQAIDESAWGQSTLASQDSNLFGIKGLGPGGSDSLPTQEFQNGQWVTVTAQFRTYDDIAESIADHGKLLATSGYYTAAMTQRQTPNAFAQALTGMYATNPDYGSNLISLMRRFNLYRFDPAAPSARAQAAAAAHAPSAATRTAAVPGVPQASAPNPAVRATAAPRPGVTEASSPRPAATTQPTAAPQGPAPTRPSVTSPAPAPAAPTLTPRRTVPAQASTTPRATTPAQPAATPRGRTSAQPGASAGAAGGIRPAATPARRAQAGPASTQTAVPHPFATPQPTRSAAAPATAPAGPAAPTAPAAPAGSGQATIPGIEPAPGTATTRASAQIRSSDTTVVTDLAAVFRPSAAPAAPQAGDTARYQAARGQRAASRWDAGAGKRSGSGSGTGADGAAAVLASVSRVPEQKGPRKRKSAAPKARKPAQRYQPQLPPSVKSAFLASARKPLTHAELVYRDVAGNCGISWKLLAACDWMQCDANPRYSPVRGEKLGTVNADGTVFRTKSEALTQCAQDLVTLADTVYHIDLTVPVELSILELARVFAAFRWGGLLKLHSTSAMEFPYSVQGLTEQYASMRWPRIADPLLPDKAGARFRRPFGAVPVVLSLDYPATV